MSTKRTRSDAESDVRDSLLSLGTQPLAKSARASPTPPAAPAAGGSGSSLIHRCTLPPTCAPPIGRPTTLPDAQSLERHYATYHTFVCEEGACRCVFPEARFLELHQTECHDPLAAVRKERGEKIFACFVADCPKLFSAPKNRRLHLIQAHSYPKQYFFAITNRGIAELLKRYGEGASLVRGEWKPRAEGAGAMDEDAAGADSSDSDAGARASIDVDSPPASPARTRERPPHESDDVAALAARMGGLALVPPAVRFGRGGQRAPHGPVPPPPRGRGRGVRNDVSASIADASGPPARSPAMAFVPPQVRAREAARARVAG